MKFFDEIVNNASKDQLFNVVYYGPSTTSVDFVFPNWGQVVQYVMREELTKIIGDYKKAFWNFQVSNRGLDGASSGDLLERMDDLVLNSKPDLVFLSAGKNDAYYEIDKEITRKNTREMIGKLLDGGARVVFVTSVPSSEERINEKISDYVEVDREVAKEFLDNENFVFIDFCELFPEELIEKSYTLITKDGNDVVGLEPGDTDSIHYNKFGNLVVAKIFLKEVFGIDFDENKFFDDLSDLTKEYPEYEIES